MNEHDAYNGGSPEHVCSVHKPDRKYRMRPNLPMGYYDGNTVTAIWNYAQHYAMSDNSFATTFGVTVAGHLNLVSGETHGWIISFACRLLR